ncbi:hypothetical protein chiPu_0029181, partial [Chiloscyllium punctatum]|nr:hypothetical protein [Chiloscyllium punctatum]
MAAGVFGARIGRGERTSARTRPALGSWVLLFLPYLGLGLVPSAADMTDGNSEHLKREHSLMKPYQ